MLVAVYSIIRIPLGKIVDPLPKVQSLKYIYLVMRPVGKILTRDRYGEVVMGWMG